ncbi:MAG: hypothetical protein LBE98_02425 [Puniceicoccales bacterium]|jgi:hypothetical protein|nr:hypothetical protein [Puniceicoccales bacterium]
MMISLIIQTCAAYLALNREIAAQQELYTSDESNEDFYGKVAEVVGSGITRDELMVYESLSGIRPYVKQAELLKSFFAGDTKAVQQIMGEAKRQCLSLFCFFHISRLKQMSVPVILAHLSQLALIVGNVREYQRSRFGQDAAVLDVTHGQLKDVEQLKQILENPKATKENHQGIIARTSLLNVFQLTFQETCVHQNDPEKFELLRDILRFFKTETRGICDEADMNLNVMEEVNFPSGHGRTNTTDPTGRWRCFLSLHSRTEQIAGRRFGPLRPFKK